MRHSSKPFCSETGGDNPEQGPGHKATLGLFSWGRGESGVLGHSSDRDESLPRQVYAAPLEGKDLLLECGLFHSAIVSDGDLWMWGKGSGGRLGQGDEEWAHEPQMVQSVREISGEPLAQMSLGGLHSSGVTPSGQVFTWGHGGFGAL
eukprot:gene12411-14663_t